MIEIAVSIALGLILAPLIASVVWVALVVIAMPFVLLHAIWEWIADGYWLVMSDTHK